MTVYKAPCEHGFYDAHGFWDDRCPGGTVLDPEQTIIIEKVDGEWPEWVLDAFPGGLSFTEESVLDALAAAQEGRNDDTD